MQVTMYVFNLEVKCCHKYAQKQKQNKTKTKNKKTKNKKQKNRALDRIRKLPVFI